MRTSEPKGSKEDTQVVDFVMTHTSAFILCVCGDAFRASGKPRYVERKQRAWQAKHNECVEVKRDGEKVFWLSFCDADRPKGQQFLGACVVKVSAAEADEEALTLALRFPFAQPHAEWLAAAVTKAHRLGCDPGGEVASHELPIDHPAIAFYELGVLMDRETIERIDRRIEESQAGDAVARGSTSQHEPPTRD